MNNMPFFEMLQTNPGLSMHSTEDTKCKALFSMLGILDDFTRDVTPNTSMLAVDGHPTHWIFGCCHSGNSDKMENGYINQGPQTDFGRYAVSCFTPHLFTLFEVAMNEKLRSRTRGLAMYGIAALVSWGDISRAEGIRWLRQMFLAVQEMNEVFTTTYWGSAVGAIALSELKRELKWLLKSDSLSQIHREMLLARLQSNSIDVFRPDITYFCKGNFFHHLFTKEVRAGERGYLLKAPIPDLKMQAQGQSDSTQGQRVDEQTT